LSGKFYLRLGYCKHLDTTVYNKLFLGLYECALPISTIFGVVICDFVGFNEHNSSKYIYGMKSQGGLAELAWKIPKHPYTK